MGGFNLSGSMHLYTLNMKKLPAITKKIMLTAAILYGLFLIGLIIYEIGKFLTILNQ